MRLKTFRVEVRVYLTAEVKAESADDAYQVAEDEAAAEVATAGVSPPSVEALRAWRKTRGGWSSCDDG